MSMENELEKLRIAVENLTKVIGGVSKIDAEEEAEIVEVIKSAEVSEVVEPEKTPVPPAPNSKETKPKPKLVKPVETVKSKIISVERAQEISEMMLETARNLGITKPVQDLLIEFKILGASELRKVDENKFIKRLEEL